MEQRYDQIKIKGALRNSMEVIHLLILRQWRFFFEKSRLFYLIRIFM